jgi:hypothetical protein
MALGFTHLLTEMSTRNRKVMVVGSRARQPHRHLGADCLTNMGSSKACFRDNFSSFTFTAGVK